MIASSPTIHTSDGFQLLIDMRDGAATYYTAAPSFPKMQRQLYGHPFRSLVNYPFDDPVYGGAGDVTLDPRQMRVSVRSVPVPLSPQEYRLVSYLMLHAGRVVSQQELAEQLHAEHFARL